MSRGARLTRREALVAGGGVALGAGVATGVGFAVRARPPTIVPASESSRFQLGVAQPETPQSHGLIAVFDFAELTSTALSATLMHLSTAILTCTSASAFDPDVTPEGPGDLTVTIGLGPRAIRAVDPTLPGALDLPRFAGDDTIEPNYVGGDLLVAIYSSDAGVLDAVLRRLTSDVPAISQRWQQRGFRSSGYGTVARNPFGYKDGVIVPRGDAELAENVWITDGALANATVCVIRRLRLAVNSFRAQPIGRQDEIVGRRRLDGAPLSGGAPDGPIDVNAKTASGELLIPPRSHVRAAHPSFTGSALMLRRGYAYANGIVTLADGTEVDDSGLMFICFQNDLEVFAKTQLRLDELDDLREFTTTTASATFLILPGFSEDLPLGAPLGV